MYGLSPLFYAVMHGHYKIMRLLLQKGADGTINKEKASLLHYAAYMAWDRNQIRTIEKKIDIDYVRCFTDIESMGFDVTLTDINGETPLFYACYSGLESILDYYSKKKAFPDPAKQL
ncbi:MAG: ankyrin repeat domain-containing protein [Spirochaetales bacterium]|nr:ankyrin repeat domain-containing protein [Spirochaetales bacterium]